MPKISHLYGTLEPSGFKGFPSKVYDMKEVNPPQPVPEEGQRRIGKILSTGLPFNKYDTPLPKDTIDKFPMAKPGTNWRKQSKPTGTYGADMKASNPETITPPLGQLPVYPEEIEIKNQLARSERTPEERKAIAAKLAKVEVKRLPKQPLSLQAKEKYSPEKIKQLEDLGFPTEVIERAINDEIQRDIGRALANPGLLAEAQVSEAVNAAYNAVRAKRAMDGRNLNNGLGEGAEAGEGGGFPAPPPGASLADAIAHARGQPNPRIAMLPNRQRRLAEIRARGRVDAGAAAAAAAAAEEAAEEYLAGGGLMGGAAAAFGGGDEPPESELSRLLRSMGRRGFVEQGGF